MEHIQPKFKTVADGAENILKETGEKLLHSEKGINLEEIKKYLDELVETKAEAIMEILLKNKRVFTKVGWENVASFFWHGLLPVLEGFPPLLGEQLVRKIISFDGWKDLQDNNKEVACIAVSTIFSALGEWNVRQGKEKKTDMDMILEKYLPIFYKKKNNDEPNMPIETISFEFSGSDFPYPPDYFGTRLVDKTTLTLNGNAGNWVGLGMTGGTLSILGEVELFRVCCRKATDSN